MATRGKSIGRHAFLPYGMTAFLKQRAGQFMGFFMVCSSVLLGVMMISFHPTDPSWNLAIDGPVKNILAYPGAVIADGLLQVFGVVSGFWVIALFGWGVRSMTVKPLRWAIFRGVAFILAVLFATCAASQWSAPSSWNLPNSLGGALGNILNQQSQALFGASYISCIVISITFTLLSLSLLILSLGVSFKSFGRGIRNAGHFVKFMMTMITRGMFTGFRWGTRRIISSEGNEPTLRIDDEVVSTSVKREDEFEQRDNPVPIVMPSYHTENTTHAYQDDQEPDMTTVTGSQERTSRTWRKSNPNLIHYEGEEDQKGLKLGSKDIESYGEMTDSSFHNLEEYELPSMDLLDPPLQKAPHVLDPVAIEESARHLKIVLEEFGVRGEVVAVRPGPVVTMYEFKPAAGIKTSRVIGLADDIARSMSAISARIAVIPGRNVIGIELPNANRETVYLREILQTEMFEKSTIQLALILGKDIGGQPVIADLTRMPHLLVAGTTGSGKSVAVNTMILSLLFRLPPDRCKFIMIDPKMLELSVYDGIPHLLTPVVTDPKKAIIALKWAVREMENRYRAMAKLGVRNIDGYNSRVKEARKIGEMLVRRVQTGFDPDSGRPVFENQPLDLEPLPYIVVVVDEMADLMMVAGKEIEAAVQRLAQMARAAGIHLIMATQRPSVDVITGTIKANFPTRISFQVTSKIDSRTILGEQGAEQLLGQGDMLYMAGGGRITRVHGPFVRDGEVENIVAFLKAQAEPVYIDSITDDEGENLDVGEDGGKGGDDLYRQAVEIVLREGKASTSFIQRHLQIGYNKAAGIIEAMEKNGIISAANHVGKREILR